MDAVLYAVMTIGAFCVALIGIGGIWIGVLWVIGRDQHVVDSVRIAVALGEQEERDAREADVARLVRERLARYDAEARADRARREKLAQAWQGLERIVEAAARPQLRLVSVPPPAVRDARLRVTRAQARWRRRHA